MDYMIFYCKLFIIQTWDKECYPNIGHGCSLEGSDKSIGFVQFTPILIAVCTNVFDSRHLIEKLYQCRGTL